MNKKIILSLLLVLLVAISVSAVSAADDNATATDGNSTVVEPSADAVEIQNKIDNAQDGDTIELENKTYEVTGATFTFDKQVTVKGNGATIKASGAEQGGKGALMTATVAGTSFEGITFVNTDGHKAYGEQVSGYAIQLAIENGTVDKCAFIDWGSGVFGRGAAFCTISDSYFNGSSESVTNGGKKEYGTKAINLMGSHDITVKGCTFEGQVLDGISIASNSGNNIMTDNTFIENCYAIYFGGASTQGCVIANNTFIRCGWCEDAEGNVIFKDLPVVSTQKAANGYIIADNTIEATEGSIFMKAESGNTAHGYPSSIGDINITGNKITATEGATPESITFMYILSNSGPLSPYAPINIVNNTIDAGITPVTVWYADWNEKNGTGTIIPAADLAKSVINTVEVNTAEGTATVALLDVNGAPQAGKTLSYIINGGDEVNATTDENGQLVISVKGAATNSSSIADIISMFGGNRTNGTNTTDISSIIGMFGGNGTNGTNSSIADIIGMFGGNGTNGTNTTDISSIIGMFGGNGTNGTNSSIADIIAMLGGNDTAAKDYTIAISFAGDSKLAPSSTNIALKSTAAEKTVTQIQADNITVESVSGVDGKVGDYFRFYLRDAEGNPLVNKAISVGFNGHVYDYVTDENGSAKTQINLAKAGGYTFAVCFLGDEQYNSSFAVAKITVTQQTPKLTAKAATYKAAAKTKSLSVTFKSKFGKVVSGRTIKVTVNGKTYTAKTNSKGVATVKVSISKKGTYTYTASFAGDTIFKATSAKAKLVIK